jgi:hypothetical protein
MREPDGMRHLMGLVSELNAAREERRKHAEFALTLDSAPTRPRRFRCRIGRHRWVMDRYWSIGGLLVDGRVCRDCGHSERKRVVVHRP